MRIIGIDKHDTAFFDRIDNGAGEFSRKGGASEASA